MSDVKTYSLVGDPHEAGMEEDENLGQWVRIEDFEQLQTKVQELEEDKDITSQYIIDKDLLEDYVDWCVNSPCKDIKKKGGKE